MTHSIKLQLHLFSSWTSPVHDDCIDLDLTYACADRDAAVKVAADMARGIVRGDNVEWCFVEVVEVDSADGELVVVSGHWDGKPVPVLTEIDA